MSIVNYLHSLYGRKVGVHKHGYLLSQSNDVSAGSTSANLNSSTAARMPAGGVTYLDSTAATTYIMDAPIPGVFKTCTVKTTANVAHKVELASGAMWTSTQSSGIAITLLNNGETMFGVGLTTAIFQIIKHDSTAALTTT